MDNNNVRPNHMNKHLYKAGAVALALAMSGLPAIALARDSVETEDSVRVESEGQRVVQTGVGIRVDDEGQGRKVEVTSVQSRSDDESAEATTSVRQESRGLTVKQGRIELKLERDDDRASSLEDLKQRIELRRQELDDEEASSTPETRDIVRNANPVRLAVHSLLASKDLLDGIGQQVSEIAKRMNDSIATTTDIEIKIKSRGFLTRILFGGDNASAKAIVKAVERNKENITTLTELLNQTTISTEVRATLTAQLNALEEAQTRLTALAQKENKRWGFFSWRF